MTFTGTGDDAAADTYVLYQPRFCSRCGASIGWRVPLLEYAIVLAVAAVVWAIVEK